MEDPPPYTLTPNELKSFTDILSSERRVDGRRPHDTRRFHIDFRPNAAIVRLGRTLVSCTNTLAQEAPAAERPSEGRHTIAISSPHSADFAFRTEALSQMRGVLHKTRALDLESLVVRIGELAWSVRSDIVIIDNDGGLLEAMNLALAASLLATKLPGPRGMRPLVLHHLPLAITFGIFEAHLLVADPTAREAAAMRGTVTVFANAQGELCGLFKSGGAPLRQAAVDAAVAQAIGIARTWHAEVMRQMGANAPLLLRKIAGAPRVEEGAKREEEEPRDEQEIAKEVAEEFRSIAKEDDEEQFDDEDEEIDPGLLSFLQQ